MKKYIDLIIVCFFLLCITVIADENNDYQLSKKNSGCNQPSVFPDRIVLNLTEDPSSSISVTWRTSAEVDQSLAEIAVATADPKFMKNARSIVAKTQTMDATNVMGSGIVANYHSVTFKDLKPETLYVYRVGDGRVWSEWIHFTTASDSEKPFSFLYVGDAQNQIFELWSRLIREAYKKEPNARFIVHSGDLVNNAHNEQEWHEWFEAGSWILRSIPSIPVPGNHEYGYKLKKEIEAQSGEKKLSYQWNYQFNLPFNGVKGLEGSVYYIDYQNTRMINMNSNRMLDEQAAWLNDVLASNPKTWTIVTFHHPVYSSSERRNNKELRKKWKPILEKHGVDLVLQGHDHSYARGRSSNIPHGNNIRGSVGTVYVVSIAGAKMYKLRPNMWNDFNGVVQDTSIENTQLFQVIRIKGRVLSYEAYTAVGDLVDAFDIVKGNPELGLPNVLIEKKD